MVRWIQLCANGPRGAEDGAAVPLSPGDLGRSVAEAVEAGACDVHVHPKSPCGQDTLAPRAVAETLAAVRAVTTVPVGVTTGAWAEADPEERVARVRSWTVLPDHASVNWHEPGAESVARALLERGVGVEAGLWSGTDGAELFARSPLRGRVLRVLAEVMDPDPETATVSARALLTAIGPTEGRPVLLHGQDGSAWPVLDLAARLDLLTRIGLEDTLLLPDGQPAPSNAQLVASGLSQYESAHRSS
ncbi:3-keto-5-aminohexanoate cleavage protein [Actinomycetota bacterium Odt1-20B]